MTMDRLSGAFEFKADTVDDSGTFTGYGSTFGGPPDSYGDVIAPGAFTKSLAEHSEAGTAPALLWQHQTDLPLGKWISIREDRRGLAVKGKLTLAVEKAREAYALLKDSAINGLSIGYRTRESEAVKAGGRLLKDVELFEVSLVTMPANTAARVGQVKSALDAGQVPTVGDLEHGLRGMGLSRGQAKALLARGYGGLAPEDQDALLAELKRLGAAIRA